MHLRMQIKKMKETNLALWLILVVISLQGLASVEWYNRYDINHDGEVNIVDLSVLAVKIQEQSKK